MFKPFANVNPADFSFQHMDSDVRITPLNLDALTFLQNETGVDHDTFTTSKRHALHLAGALEALGFCLSHNYE